MMHVDTSFLVDLLRESRRRRPGPATAFLNRIQGEELRVDVHVACELLAGAELYVRPSVERERVQRLCAELADLIIVMNGFRPPTRGSSPRRSGSDSASRPWIC